MRIGLGDRCPRLEGEIPGEEPESPGPLTVPCVTVGMAESQLLWWEAFSPCLSWLPGWAQPISGGAAKAGGLGLAWRGGGRMVGRAYLDRWSGESHLVGDREVWGGGRG